MAGKLAFCIFGMVFKKVEYFIKKVNFRFYKNNEMYSKEQTRELKNIFWTRFSDAYPKKWLLHKTKIKDFAFKFYADNKKIEVMLAIECKDEDLRKIYFQKIECIIY